MRLFTAIELHPGIRDRLAALQDTLRPLVPAVRWTAPSNLHITLKFLGEVREQDVPLLRAGLAAAELAKPLQLQCDRLVFFPTEARARIIGMDIAGDRAALTQLHGEIESACAAIGFAREDRPYHPHITLARCRMPLRRHEVDPLRAGARALAKGPSFQASGFALIQSQLGSAGSRYQTVATFPASGDAQGHAS